MTKRNLEIHINDFNGPLELLLHLIRQSKMDIYDIDIKDITEQYFQYLQQMKEMNFDIAGDFFVMAANLMRIKSKMLLDKESEADEEEEDPRDDLVAQLLEYKRYQKAAQKLKAKELRRNQFHSKERHYSKAQLVIKPNEFQANLLSDTYEKIMKRFAWVTEPKISEIKDWNFTVTEQTKQIKSAILQNQEHELHFSSLYSSESPIEEVVTDFLAVLEMVNNKVASVFQKQHEHDILIKGK